MSNGGHWWAWLLALVLGAMATPVALAQAPEAVGRLLDFPQFAAPGLGEQHVTVWLPADYDTSGARYGVLYMHDGQSLFDTTHSMSHKMWAAHVALRDVMAKGRIGPWIIVSIWAPLDGLARWRQYMPVDFRAQASPALRARIDAFTQGPLVSQAYLAWLTGTLKPWVDAMYRTLPDRDHTAMIGSSMGGLITCQAFVQYPQIIGRAGCLSAHWPGDDPRALVMGAPNPEVVALWQHWVDRRLGAPAGRRLWLDHGTATLDAFYAPYQTAIDARIAAAGWQQGRDWQSKVYEGAAHDETAWGARLPEVLDWLLAP